MFDTEPLKDVKPDSKGRVNLGSVLDSDVDRYKVFKDEHNRIILEPYADIPMHEVWLFKNKEAFESVRRGVEDSKTGNLVELDDDIQEIIKSEMNKLKS